RIAVPVSLRDLPRTLTELLLAGADSPFPGHSLARSWIARGPVQADPILSQLESPRLVGEDFMADQVGRTNSVFDQSYCVSDSGGKSPGRYPAEDGKQQRNLADDPAQRSRLERLRYSLAPLRRAPGRL